MTVMEPQDSRPYPHQAQCKPVKSQQLLQQPAAPAAPSCTPPCAPPANAPSGTQRCSTWPPCSPSTPAAPRDGPRIGCTAAHPLLQLMRAHQHRHPGLCSLRPCHLWYRYQHSRWYWRWYWPWEYRGLSLLCPAACCTALGNATQGAAPWCRHQCSCNLPAAAGHSSSADPAIG
jgi:hypothetical protein